MEHSKYNVAGHLIGNLPVVLLLICTFILQIVTTFTLFGMEHRQTDNPGDIRYETVERFGNIDTDGTLFIAADGNMYAVDAQYPEETGNQFLLRLNGKNTETKADDEVLEVWASPVKH